MKLALTLSLKLHSQQRTCCGLEETSARLAPLRVSWARTRLCQPGYRYNLRAPAPQYINFLKHNIQLTCSGALITQSLVSLNNKSLGSKVITSGANLSREGASSLLLQELVLRPSALQTTKLLTFWYYFCTYTHFLRDTQALIVLFAQQSGSVASNPILADKLLVWANHTNRLSSDQLRLSVFLRNL